MVDMVDDPHLWLEDIDGDDALDWVRRRNDTTIAELTGDEFDRMRAEALEVLDTDTRIPYVRRRGEYLYNFWRDANNPGACGGGPPWRVIAPIVPPGTSSSTSTSWPAPMGRTGCGRGLTSSNLTTRWH